MQVLKFLKLRALAKHKIGSSLVVVAVLSNVGPASVHRWDGARNGATKLVKDLATVPTLR